MLVNCWRALLPTVLKLRACGGLFKQVREIDVVGREAGQDGFRGSVAAFGENSAFDVDVFDVREIEAMPLRPIP